MAERGSQSEAAPVKFVGDDGNDAPDSDDDPFVRKLPMKTLANLASYTNPFQQKAQNLLRVKSNSSQSEPFARMPIDLNSSHVVIDAPLGLAPAALNDLGEGAAPNTIQHLQTSPSFVQDQVTHMDSRPLVNGFDLPAKIPNAQSMHSRQLFPLSTLATGPGAPEPLKAGPPGQRPQGPSKIESAFTSNWQGPSASNTTLPIHGAYPTHPYPEYPVLNMSKQSGGFPIGDHPRPISAMPYGHDGTRSSSEEHNIDAVSEVASVIRNFYIGAHSSSRSASGASAGERSSSGDANLVAPQLGLEKQDYFRSQRNSSESTGYGSGSGRIYQTSGYNAVSDTRVHTALCFSGQGPESNNRPLLTQSQHPTMMDPSLQNVPNMMDPHGAQSVTSNPSQISNLNGQTFAKYLANEALGSSISQCELPGLPYYDAGLRSGADERPKQPATMVQATPNLQDTSILQTVGYRSENIDELDLYSGSRVGAHLSYLPYGFDQYPYGATKMDDRMLLERDARIDAWFYSNTSRLGKSMSEALEERNHPKARASRFGAIRDGRPMSNAEPKKVYSEISIEEANNMPASEHAKPLLNLAFQSLLDWKDCERARELSKKTERKGKYLEDESDEGYGKLGSAALLPSSVPDSN